MTRVRPSKDDVFLDVARDFGRLSTCVRAIEKYGGIGAVLVEDATNHVLGVGYCGSLPGQPHCTDAGCMIASDGGCQRTLHAEMNAILHARSSDGSKTLYCNVSPCVKCLQYALAVGVRRVVFRDLYRIHDVQVAICHETGAAWCHVAGP